MARSRARASNLLRPNENEAAFTVLGNKSVALSTTVAQLFIAHPDPRRWTKHRTGVLCFVKDNAKKSYFIRMIDITRRALVYDQELFEQFEYKTPKSHFHTFADDKYMVGLNFADPGEASHFREEVQQKIRAYQQKKVKKRSQPLPPQPQMMTGPPPQVPQRSPGGPLPPTPMGGGGGPTGHGGGGPTGHGGGPTGHGGGPTGHSGGPTGHGGGHGMGGGMQSQSLGIPSNVKVKNDKGTVRASKGGRKKLTKGDISGPSNFVHVQHVGFDPEKGFDLNNLDNEWSTLFNAVGVSNEQLQDKDTAKFIYDFVQSQGGIEVASKQLKQQAPPPPPHAIRGAAPAPPSHRSRAAAPPPPTRGASGGHGAPPPPPPSRGQAPPPPPPPTRSSAPPPPPPPPIGGPAPPPPPPPPEIGAPPPLPPPGPPMRPSSSASPPPLPSGGRSDLLSQIHHGMSLKPVQQSEDSGSGDTRGGLLEAIRKGTNLRPVSESEKGSPPPEMELGGMAGALARALQDRSRVIQVSDDEDDDYDDDDDSDEWDD